MHTNTPHSNTLPLPCVKPPCLSRYDIAVWVPLVASLRLLLLGLEPVGESSGLAGGGDVLALDLDGQLLVLLEAAGEVGLLGGLRGGGGAEGLDLADGVGVLDGGGLVGLELLEVELLDEVGCGRRRVLVYDVIEGVVYSASRSILRVSQGLAIMNLAR